MANASVPSTIYFATGNKKKLEEVVAILACGHELPFKVEPAKLDLPELQGEPEDISKEKCRIAAKQASWQSEELENKGPLSAPIKQWQQHPSSNSG
eukprot:gene11929-12072_t